MMFRALVDGLRGFVDQVEQGAYGRGVDVDIDALREDLELLTEELLSQYESIARFLASRGDHTEEEDADG